MINGNDLIEWGYEPGPWFKEAIKEANRLRDRGYDHEDVMNAIADFEPAKREVIELQDGMEVKFNIEANTEDEWKNLESVKHTMFELVKTPTIVDAAVMPDACPAGPPGTIPVGGVAKVENAIHPGMHSADICCSVALTNLGNVDPKKVMDAGMKHTHFGGGGRKGSDVVGWASSDLLKSFSANPFLNGLETDAREHMATQGDGNHFFFVGVLESTGDTVLVTHHGSRRPGAMLYKRGMRTADKYRRELSPQTLKQNAWIPMDTEEGEFYWRALQIIRAWTKRNHFTIHDMVAEEVHASPVDRFWNEHNFVFERDGFYYHGKGATPAWKGFADDEDVHPDLTLIPLNMSQPILIVEGHDAPHGLGFSPHGAGRNFSRSEHFRRQKGSPSDVVRRETKGLDVRFWTGNPDVSELPSAYKDAETVQRQIRDFSLAETKGRVMPYGCIMAGEWRKK